jgi:hypothetical protein
VKWVTGVEGLFTNFGHRAIAGARHIGKKLGPSGSLSSLMASNPCFK